MNAKPIDLRDWDKHIRALLKSDRLSIEALEKEEAKVAAAGYGFQVARVRKEIADLALRDDPRQALERAEKAESLLEFSVKTLRLWTDLRRIAAEAHAQLGEWSAVIDRTGEAITWSEGRLEGKHDHLLRATSRSSWIRVHELNSQAWYRLHDLDRCLSTIELTRARADRLEPVRNINVAEIQARLSHDDVIVSYFFFDPSTLLIAAIAQDFVDAEVIALDEAKRAIIGAFAAAFGNAGWTPDDRFLEPVPSLTDVLLPHDIRRAIEKRRKPHVKFMCHKEIHALPLCLLDWGHGPLGAYAALSRLPSLRSIFRDLEPPKSRRTLAIGIEKYDARPELGKLTDMPSLCRTLEEQAEGVDVLTDRDGDVGSVKDRLLHRIARNGDDYAFLFFGCHGDPVAADVPDESKIFLGDDELSSKDIAAWQLTADVVFAGACFSGQRSIGGRDFPTWPGDEFFGLAAAFRLARARQVIGGLWKVHADVVGKVMPELHDAWTKGASVAEALRLSVNHYRDNERGKIKSRKTYWAPFVVEEFAPAPKETESHAFR